MTTYTSGLRLTNQPSGGNATTWGDVADDNFEFIDDALTGRVSVDLTGTSSITLTTQNGSDDQARNMNIYMHGVAASAQSVIIPASEKVYLVESEVSGENITVRTAGGTGVTFTKGDRRVVYCDGVSVKSYGLTSALDPSNNLSDLGDTSAARDNLGVATVTAMQTLILEAAYPVGSIYINRTVATNPNTLLGIGTWVQVSDGRVLVGVGTGVDVSGVSVTISAETCGGQYEVMLTSAQVPPIIVSIGINESIGQFNSGSNNLYQENLVSRDYQLEGNPDGGTSAVSLVQPWYSVYMWERTA